MNSPSTHQALTGRLATAPGVVRPGAAFWDGSRTPIHPLSIESAFADPALLRDLGGTRRAVRPALGVDVVVGAAGPRWDLLPAAA
jgi:orotate phosphoribosyltransferase